MRTLDALIAESPVFHGLAQQHLDLIAGCASNTGFETGERLFREGDAADVFYLIRHGIVAVEIYIPNRGQLTIQTAGAGEIVGWSWLLPPYRWHFTGRAVEDVRAVQFDGTCLRNKARINTTLGYELTTRFAQKLVASLEATQLQLTDMYGEPNTEPAAGARDWAPSNISAGVALMRSA
jgi:CRP/FNR family transcriptional regulator, cyclic AMP receptor protein